MKPLFILLLLCSACHAAEPTPDYKALYEQAVKAKAQTDRAFHDMWRDFYALKLEHANDVKVMERALRIMRGQAAEIERLRMKLDARTWQGGGR